MQIINTCYECPYHKDTNCEQLDLKRLIEYINQDDKYVRISKEHFPSWCPLEIIRTE